MDTAMVEVSQDQVVSFEYPVRELLMGQGYANVAGTQLRVEASLLASREELVASFHTLPDDPYAAAANRCRRHGRFVMLPWCDELHVRPPVPYLQGSSYNPDDGDRPRQLPPLEPWQMDNAFLRALIREDFRHLPLDELTLASPIDVGVHLVRTVARPGVPGTSSPNCLHKDGEPYTWIHVVDRRHAVGGASQIADNDQRVVYEATLAEPFDSLVVRDEAVYHAVLPIVEAPGHGWGYRDALLIDFTPFTPALVS